MKRLLVGCERWKTGRQKAPASIGLLAAVMLLAACATSSGSPPEWLRGRSTAFPEARFLTGQGQADNAAVARDRARADLVKIFEARIAEESVDRSSATRESLDGQVKQSSALKAERSVSISTARTLEGIEIAEVWHDPERKSFHALAVLDRMKAGEGLRNEINQLDDLTARALEISRGSADMLDQIAAASRATEAQQHRTTLQRDLRVIDPTGTGLPSRWDLARLESDLDQLAKRLRLSAGVGDDPVGNLETILAGAIARAGFTHAAGGEAAYQLIASLDLDQSQASGWYWAKGVLQLTLKDSSGKIRGARQFAIKSAGQQAAVARQRAMGEVDRILRAQMRDTVLGIATR